MLRRITLLITATTALVCRNVDARLWETKSQLDVRYGKPAMSSRDADGLTYVYKFNQFQVVVTLLDGKSQNEIYYHTNSSRLTPAEIEALLSFNALGNRWRVSEGVFSLFKPSGGHPIAVGLYSPDAPSPALAVRTADFIRMADSLLRTKKMRP